MNTWVLLAFIAIFFCLAAALFFMLRPDTADKRRTHRMARALAMRVAFSILLFLCILVGWKLGLIHPTGVPAGK